MKLSVQLQDQYQNHGQPPPASAAAPLLVRAKIPISIFNLPFLSHFTTTTARPSDLSLSLSTNFASGPSLKLSYTTAGASSSATPPFSLTLKSGTGVFGSPTNSPLVVSAHFSFANPNPSFSLLLKPQFGSFSLRKSIDSHSESTIDDAVVESEFVPVEVPPPPQENQSVQKSKNPNSIFKGIRMAATTQVLVMKSAALNFRWWVSSSDYEFPVLRINKIGIERVSQATVDDSKEKKIPNSEELEMLKGMCYWMKRELNGLTRVNREMKGELEEMKSRRAAVSGSGGAELREGVRKKTAAATKGYDESEGGGSSGFEEWRRKRKGGSDEINGGTKKEEKAQGSVAAAIDVESELQRAIMAANAS